MPGSIVRTPHDGSTVGTPQNQQLKLLATNTMEETHSLAAVADTYLPCIPTSKRILIITHAHLPKHDTCALELKGSLRLGCESLDAVSTFWLLDMFSYRENASLKVLLLKPDKYSNLYHRAGSGPQTGPCLVRCCHQRVPWTCLECSGSKCFRLAPSAAGSMHPTPAHNTACAPDQP